MGVRRDLGLAEALASCLAFAAVLILAHGVRAEGADPELAPEDQQAIRHTIQSQIEAFQRDDAATAFALASPAIQERFGTAEMFLIMVRTSYEPVYRPRQFRFLELVQSDGELVQKVLVIGPDGLAVLALYPMVRMKDGGWRTDGCALVPFGHKDA